MLITIITHASARDKEHNFRALTAGGQAESRQATARYRERAAGQNLPAIDRIVSSPKPRCLETAILFAKGLQNEELTASTFEVDPGLVAGEITGDELAALAASGAGEHILVSGHADMVKTLPESVQLREAAAGGGWFQSRPVLFQLETEPGRPWAEARVRFCERLGEAAWHSLLK